MSERLWGGVAVVVGAAMATAVFWPNNPYLWVRVIAVGLPVTLTVIWLQNRPRRKK
jgi:hypothetical protein